MMEKNDEKMMMTIQTTTTNNTTKPAPMHNNMEKKNKHAEPHAWPSYPVTPQTNPTQPDCVRLELTYQLLAVTVNDDAPWSIDG